MTMNRREGAGGQDHLLGRITRVEAIDRTGLHEDAGHTSLVGDKEIGSTYTGNGVGGAHLEFFDAGAGFDLLQVDNSLQFAASQAYLATVRTLAGKMLADIDPAAR
ncbi:MAG: hypothetical protein A2010_14340 [Nitrospirae bacterium GWD2_57_9]|nr:MAG: hypothetical protein A2010_14340 [Nitrospirae bacterium GWD2_57_9]